MKYYLTKCYHGGMNAGNKAKMDIEVSLAEVGFRAVGIHSYNRRNSLWAFLLNLVGVCSLFFVIRKGDTVVVQYPYKKFYAWACRLIHLKGGQTVTVIHDLGAFRRKKKSIAKEIGLLNRSDGLVVHNDSMKAWLQDHGLNRPMECLEVFDYLSDTENLLPRNWDNGCVKVMYAGALSFQKNAYLYNIADFMKGWQLELYGKGFEVARINKERDFHYHGFVASDELIACCDAHFGLVWEGDSPDTCRGSFGEYLALNNPHKLSLYIRCGLPIIIWKEAAMAPFVLANGLGVAVGSLKELNDLLPTLTANQYEEMRKNVSRIGGLLKSGFYAKKHIDGCA